MGDKKVTESWAGRVYLLGKGEVHAGFWWGNLRERDLFEEVGVDKRILLKLILKNSVGSVD
jgi:hypothetical protein